jgi:hypothetical protein
LAGRTPHEAVDNFLVRLRQSTSCITRVQLVISSGGREPGSTHIVSFDPNPTLKAADRTTIGLSVVHYYEVVRATGKRGPWKVRSAGYLYSLLDRNDHELITFHWHPQGNSDVTGPHLHVGSALASSWKKLPKAHIPTSRMTLEQIIGMAIDGFGVIPLKEDWRGLLDRNQKIFDAWKTWS